MWWDPLRISSKGRNSDFAYCVFRYIPSAHNMLFDLGIFIIRVQPRRCHTKPRQGCVQGKRRHVKFSPAPISYSGRNSFLKIYTLIPLLLAFVYWCDEKQPSCGLCLKRKLQCTYEVPKVGKGPPQVHQAITTRWINLARLNTKIAYLSQVYTTTLSDGILGVENRYIWRHLKRPIY